MFYQIKTLGHAKTQFCLRVRVRGSGRRPISGKQYFSIKLPGFPRPGLLAISVFISLWVFVP
jgi:hypothetical protein